MALNKIQPDLFRYTLTTSDLSGVVINEAPNSWDDSAVTVKRDIKDFVGNRREFSLPLGFVKQARDILKNEFLKNGIMGEASLKIEILNNNWDYEPFYEGLIDFSKADLDSTFMEVNFLDNDIQAKKQAFEDTEFEIPILTQDSLSYFANIKFPPIQMVENASFYVANQMDAAAPNWGSYGKILAMTLNESKIRLGNSLLRDTNSDRKGSQDDGQDSWNPQLWQENSFMETYKSGPIINFNIKGKVSFVNGLNNGTPVGYTLMLSWNKADGSPDPDWENRWLFDTLDYPVGEHKDISIDVSREIVMEPGYKYFLSWYPSAKGARPSAGYNMMASVDEAIVTIDYKDETPRGFEALAMPPKVLFKRLFEKMTGDNNIEVKSDILDRFPELFITCGDSIRDIYNPLIKTSFKDFWKALTGVLDVGFDIINGVPTIEEKSFFFDRSVLVTDIGPVGEYSIVPATELLFNDIRTGYESQDYETELGRQEVNNGQYWKTPVARGKSTLDLISPYRADPYGINDIIESTFYNPNKNYTNTDDARDNDVFWLWIDPTTFEPARFEGGGPVKVYIHQSYEILTMAGLVYSGIDPNDKLYNFMLSPKRNMLRHNGTIRTAMYGEINLDKNITLTKADKWTDFKIEYQDLDWFESAPVPINGMGPKFFEPFILSLSVAYPDDFYFRYMANPTGVVSININGEDYLIHPIEMSFNLFDRSDFELKGLVCAGQNLDNLFN